MTTTKQSTANPCAYFKGYSVCRTGPDKWPIFCRHHFQAHFLFENRFILAENCFNSFLKNKPIFWTTSLGEGPARGIMGQKESRWIITWWRHQMKTFSASLALCGGIHRSSVNSPHKGQWRGALMFSLICAWMNGWVNNRETGDLRRHRAHYDVIVMKKIARKSRPIQCVELDHQSGSRKQHCWKFWNPIELIVMPRYVFLYFLMAFAFFFLIKIRLRCT